MGRQTTINVLASKIFTGLCLIGQCGWQLLHICIWVRSPNCSCLVIWFCYQLIAKPGNKTAEVSWPDSYTVHPIRFIICHIGCAVYTDMKQPVAKTFEYFSEQSFPFHHTEGVRGISQRQCHMICIVSHHVSLTLWGRDNMAKISQEAFPNTFSWMKMYEFRFKSHWSWFLRVKSTIFEHWSWPGDKPLSEPTRTTRSLRSEDTPRRPMITHTIDQFILNPKSILLTSSYRIPSQNKVKAKKFAQKLKFYNFVINLTCAVANMETIDLELKTSQSRQDFQSQGRMTLKI